VIGIEFDERIIEIKFQSIIKFFWIEESWNL